MLRLKMVSGFTLIELMITVAVVGIIAAVAYPAFTDQIRKGRRAECRSGLMQSMQQQERYFSQFNKYAAFAAGATNAKTKAFSGDSLEKSACSIAAVQCSSGGNALPLNQCIELQATARSGSDSVSMLSVNSNGDKGCTVDGNTKKAPSDTVPEKCWP